MATIRFEVKKGVLYPLKKLPRSWKDGDHVELSGDRIVTDPEERAALWAEIDRLAKQSGDEEEWKKIEETLAENDRLAKEWMRREMGLDR